MCEGAGVEVADGLRKMDWSETKSNHLRHLDTKRESSKLHDDVRALTKEGFMVASEKSSLGKNKAKKAPVVVQKKLVRISQERVPAHSLDEALRVARAIGEHLGKKPSPPLRVAAAMGQTPGSSLFKMLTGASIAYGLTNGGYNAVQIELTDLALRIIKPRTEGGDLHAKREAFLKPKVIHDFMTHYSGSQLPRPDIARNVLEEDFGVPSERSEKVFEFIVGGARHLGLLKEIKGKDYVDIASPEDVLEKSSANSAHLSAGDSEEEEQETRDDEPVLKRDSPLGSLVDGDQAALIARGKRVFLTHGKNRAFIEPIKKLLQFGELEAVVSVERQSVSQPVPEKVLGEMRFCGAAIIHVEDELHLLDKDAKEHVTLNPNVLIEIGAAMALYGRRFILLVKDGVKLPSNLQGLFEVRYEGDGLDGSATIRLLESINELKKLPL